MLIIQIPKAYRYIAKHINACSLYLCSCSAAPKKKPSQEPKEASGSKFIGQISVALLTTVISAVVVLDAISWPLQWNIMKKNISSFCGR